MAATSAYAVWQRFSGVRGGKWAFSKLLCFKAPYFASIRPQFVELRPDYCEVAIRKRRSVLNHFGSVHAIAMCNMAELAGGTMTDASIPTTHRWIPKGMTVEYLKKANTDLIAVAKPASVADWSEPCEYNVNVEVKDESKKTVFRAVITMWVSPRQSNS